MTHFCLARSLRFTCRAPANSRKLSITCIKAASKSRLSNRSRAKLCTWMPIASNAISPKDISIAMIMTPMVVGSLTQR